MKRAVLFVLALLLLCSCAAAPKTGRVSEEELAKLREAYPYRDATFLSVGDRLESIQPLEEGCLVVVKIVGEPYCTVSNFLYPEPFKDVEEFKALHPELSEQSVTAILSNLWGHVDATVVDVLWSDTKTQVNETISLTFDPYWLPPNTLSAHYQENQHYICYLHPYASNTLSPEKPFHASKYYTWYLAEDDVVLSATSEPGPDSFSGLYLESFKQEVLAILNEE